MKSDTTLRPTAIEIVALSKVYSGKNGASLRAVDNLGLTIPSGQVFGFLGPNGAGKTTTIKMICGLITPTSGHVSLNGYDPARQHGTAMRQVGAVLEGSRNVYWRLSAWDNLMYFGWLKGSRGPALKMRAEQLLKNLDLWDRRRSPVREFSRGMQQKVAIACALIADPPIILLDEPTLGLDVEAAQTVRGWIGEQAREQGKTVVLTTHQLDIAQELCDRVAIIKQGRLITDRPVHELLALFRQECYRIQLLGSLGAGAAYLPAGLTISEADGETTISGTIASQRELHRILSTIADLGVPLISVMRAEPDLEEIFVRLIKAPDGVPQDALVLA